MAYELWFALGGWDHQTGEAVGGGRFLESVVGARDAVDGIVAHTASRIRLDGPGEVVALDPETGDRQDPYRDYAMGQGWDGKAAG